MSDIFWVVYIIGILPTIKGFSFLGIAVSIILFVCMPSKGRKLFEEEHPFKGTTRVFPYMLLSVSMLFFIIIPTTDTMYRMIGVEAVVRAISTEEVQDLGSELLGLGKDSIEALRENLKIEEL